VGSPLGGKRLRGDDRFMVLGGGLGGMFGLRRIFLVGAIVFIGASALAGAAGTLWFLLALRVTQGIGESLMMPTRSRSSARSPSSRASCSWTPARPVSR
jgi:MFS family permease